MTERGVDLVLDGPVARLTLSRPDRLNAFDDAMIEALRAALAEVAARDDARALVLTGAGRGFCAGADLTSLPESGAAVGERMRDLYNPLIADLRGLPIPTVAAVNGVAAGAGVGIALTCDLVVAARSASFVQVFGPKLGLVPDLGCTWHLPRLVGRARARGLALLGETLPAEQAAAWGLIWACVDDAGLLPEAERLARRLADGPTHAFRAIRGVLDEALGNSLPEQLDLERETQVGLIDRPEFREGVQAFLEKRRPAFHGEPSRPTQVA